MKKFLLMTAIAIASSANAQKSVDSLTTVNLQDVQVLSIRASKKTPMAYTDMNRDQIEQVNHGQDVPYLLSLTPSITMTSDAGNGIGYTSLRVRGTDPSRINITANGVPMNDAESSTVFWVNMGDFASSVQSMQIQRGVGTSTNGAGAFGATLNMQTENIGLQPFVGVDLSGGSYYSHKETVRFGTGLLDDHWGVQGRLSNIGSKGYLDRASTKLNSYLLQGGYFGDNTVVKLITWNGEEETYHAWNYTSKYEQELLGRRFNSCGVMGYDANGIPTGYYSNQTDNYHQQNYQLLWNEHLAPELNLNVTLHYTRGDGYYEQYKRNRKLKNYGLDDGQGNRSDLVQQKCVESDFYGTVASLIFNNHKNVEATFGGGWNKYVCDHYGEVKWVKNPVVTTTPNFEYYRHRAKKTDFNVYGKTNWQILPGGAGVGSVRNGLNAFVDLQYRHVGIKMQDPSNDYVANRSTDYVIDKKYNYFNPKFGVNYDITSSHRLYASYAIAHKEPVTNNFEELPLEEIKSERLNDLEAGYKFQSRRFSAAANLYWMNYKDQFVLTGELNYNGEGMTQNVPKSYRLGLELEAAWEPLDWLRWDGNATWSRNRVKDMTVTLNDGKTIRNLGDTPLAFSPNFILNNVLTLNYKGMRAQAQMQYVSDQYLTNTGFKEIACKDVHGNDYSSTLLLKSHFVTNLDLSYTFSLKTLYMKKATVGVTLYNLFSAKFDNNGWAAPQYKAEADGSVIAVNEWDVRDGRDSTGGQAVGFAPSAPFNVMAHLSVNF